MKKNSLLIFLLFSSSLFAQTNHISILYLKTESKQLIDNSVLLSDSIISKSILNKKYSVGSLIGQGLLGSVSELGLGFISAGAAFGYSFSHKETTLSTVGFTLLIPGSMIFGSALGVHLIAKHENPKHSFWQTVKYSAYGAGGGVVLALVFGSLQQTLNAGEVIFISLTPVLGSLFYSNYVAEWPEKKNNVEQKNISFGKMNYSFKDYYNSRQLFRVNILSIPF